MAESSIDYDRTVKAELYARLGVVEYWLVDLNVDVVTRYTEPVDGQYRRVEPVPVGASFAPRLLPACDCHGRHLRLTRGRRHSAAGRQSFPSPEPRAELSRRSP